MFGQQNEKEVERKGVLIEMTIVDVAEIVDDALFVYNVSQKRNINITLEIKLLFTLKNH